MTDPSARDLELAREVLLSPGVMCDEKIARALAQAREEGTREGMLLGMEVNARDVAEPALVKAAEEYVSGMGEPLHVCTADTCPVEICPRELNDKIARARAEAREEGRNETMHPDIQADTLLFQEARRQGYADAMAERACVGEHSHGACGSCIYQGRQEALREVLEEIEKLTEERYELEKTFDKWADILNGTNDPKVTTHVKSDPAWEMVEDTFGDACHLLAKLAWKIASKLDPKGAP